MKKEEIEYLKEIVTDSLVEQLEKQIKEAEKRKQELENEEIGTIIAENFYATIYKDLFLRISEICNELGAELIDIERKYAIEIFNRKIEELRKMVDCYIEGQKTIFSNTRIDF